ncbi:hypothetical protein JCM9533A_23090 [Catenuloplanes niger JCM 9533]
MEHINPEEAAARVLRGEAEVSPHLRTMLLSLTRIIPEDDLGLNGSYACGLAVNESDFDLDVYGAISARRVASALLTMVRDPTSDWEIRWPPDEQTNLFYVWRAAYPEITTEELYKVFQNNGRDRFNFLYRGARVSIAYHSRRRNDRARAAPVPRTEPQAAEMVHATFIAPMADEHLDLPSIFTLTDAMVGNRRFAEVTVVSLSKAFCFCRPGDRVSFRAHLSFTHDGPLLIIPSYGPEWPVRPILQVP